MNRREFSTLLPMLLAAPALAPAAQGQAIAPQSAAPHTLPTLASGQFPPGPPTAPPTAMHVSHHYLQGMLPDNIRLESHDSILAPGAPHEAIGHHKHSEIWFIREGEADLMTAGVTRRLKAGDIGICIAGDEHYIANASRTEPVTYLVLTVGPPEQKEQRKHPLPAPAGSGCFTPPAPRAATPSRTAASRTGTAPGEARKGRAARHKAATPPV